ncbi:Subtilisin-like protease SDD1 [Acorus calamus]|uniref:Subtilisin-like protease SDD1 n=1 Tax=Acorus calamus TaxID=4465 RepID=A0AAV9D7V6_ACOCL|nr:Subtilisin-like protease SDD1 [Acorus calamus]
MAMATKKTSPFLFLVLLFSTFVAPALAAKKTYIVYLGAHKHGKEATLLDYELATDSHYELLGSVLGSEDKAKDAIIYSYNKFINGFSAVLEEEEAMAIAESPNVVSIFPDKNAKLLTTQSWEFVGLERGGRVPVDSIWSKARFGEDIIIATLDTGVWPESQSFQDEGMGPVPSRWKGSCQNTTKEAKGITCNRKLIGAKYYYKGFEADGSIKPSLLSARDSLGHGTHTLSTAAGRFVPGANTFGFAAGTAKGGCPNARVAAYKICWPTLMGGSCTDSDMMAAIDDAIHDGVDVISMSLGKDIALDYAEDAIAISTFHAAANGIPVVLAGGNSGPATYSVTNVAPWMITVAASSIDRVLSSDVILGNGMRLEPSH